MPDDVPHPGVDRRLLAAVIWTVFGVSGFLLAAASFALVSELRALRVVSGRLEQKLDMLAERKERPPGGVPQAER